MERTTFSPSTSSDAAAAGSAPSSTNLRPTSPAAGAVATSLPAEDSTAPAATATTTTAAATTTSEQPPTGTESRSKKKPARKKRKALDNADGEGRQPKSSRPKKSKKKKDTKDGESGGGTTRKKARRSQSRSNKALLSGHGGGMGGGIEELSAAQIAANEQMRKVLEEDCYSALGSIVPDSESDDDDDGGGSYYRGRGVAKLDRTAILSAMRKRLWMERMASGSSTSVVTSSLEQQEKEVDDDVGAADAATADDDNDDVASRSSSLAASRSKKKRSKKVRRGGDESLAGTDNEMESVAGASEIMSVDESREVLDPERDEGSIFGATVGSSNFTWVECDKCGKWRRLRGVIDEKKLPPKWYCSMNKNDPERAKCSAPEEEYEPANTPESQADARTRKHLRIWVRRLQCNEAYESRQPTMTRGKKRNATTNSKEPYQWVRCCNPSCGKWRALLRCMDAKTNVLDHTTDGVWYCVMNTWDEKIASCAAPQENLPALNCPPWVGNN